MSEELRNTVASEVTHRETFNVADFETFPGSNGRRTKVAEFQTDRPLAIRNGAPVSLAIMAYEEFTADGGSPETFNLSHNLVESGATSDDLTVIVGDSEVAADTVDYAGDTVDVETNAGDTVGVFYASGKQARVELQKTAPNGTHETLWTGDLKLLHLRDHAKDPVQLSLTSSYWESVIPTDWNLEVYVDAPYVARFEKDVGGDGNAERATNALLSIPYLGGRGEIEGLSETVRIDAAQN